MCDYHRLRAPRVSALAVLALLILGSFGTANAANCNINTEPSWDGNITSGWLAQAQTFEAPSADCSLLSDWEFRLSGRTSPGQVTFNIYQWGQVDLLVTRSSVKRSTGVQPIRFSTYRHQLGANAWTTVRR